MKKAIQKTIKVFAIVLLVMALGGIGTFTIDRYLFPYLASTKTFSNFEFFKKGLEDVTVIQKTEQIYVKEETSLSKIAGKISPSVVGIISYPKNQENALTEKTSMKEGTGVITTSDGMILTHASAILEEEIAEQEIGYRIKTREGEIFEGKIIGKDSYSDLVFLKIDASNLPVISFGDSENSQAGEKIIGVGNNLGALSNKYITGLLESFDPTFNLSAKAISFSDKLEGVFIPDMQLEEEFSGGPIVDYSGQTIGILGLTEKNNKQVFFAIPSNKLKIVIEKALNQSLKETPIFGAYYLPITPSYASVSDLSVDEGALIYSASGQASLAMLSDSPAERSGLELGDIIIKVNDQEISLQNSLPDILYQHKLGENLKLLILRNNEQIELEATL